MKTYPIIIDDETHAKLRKKCFKENISIKDIFDNAIEDFLKSTEE